MSYYENLRGVLQTKLDALNAMDPKAAKYIFGVLAAGFLVAGAWSRLRRGGNPATAPG